MKTRFQCWFILLTLIAGLNQTMAALQITTTNLPDGQVNVYYDQSLDASSSHPSFTWSIISNALPPGLTFDSSGEIYGTPTNTGSYNFTVHVVDGGNKSTNQSLSLIIYSLNPVLSAPAQTSGDHFQLSLGGAPGQTYYTVEFSTNLIDWIPILTTNLPNGPSLNLNLPKTNKLGFYQAYESGISIDQSVFSFSAPVIYVNVTNGVAVIPITRVSGLSSNVCVNYATSDGTAIGGCDYEPVSGQLCFDIGVASNSFSIPISLGCSTNQSATVDLQISDPNGNNTLNALLVIQRPKPILAIDTNAITILVPGNCGQSVTISNAGPQDSLLNYKVVDDGALLGYLNLADSDPSASVPSGSFVAGALQSGQTAQINFTVLDQFATNWIGGTLVTAPSIYTPGAANYEKFPISVTITPVTFSYFNPSVGNAPEGYPYAAANLSVVYYEGGTQESEFSTNSQYQAGQNLNNGSASASGAIYGSTGSASASSSVTTNGNSIVMNASASMALNASYSENTLVSVDDGVSAGALPAIYFSLPCSSGYSFTGTLSGNPPDDVVYDMYVVIEEVSADGGAGEYFSMQDAFGSFSETGTLPAGSYVIYILADIGQDYEDEDGLNEATYDASVSGHATLTLTPLP